MPSLAPRVAFSLFMSLPLSAPGAEAPAAQLAEVSPVLPTKPDGIPPSNRVNPEYPSAALRNSLAGWVHLSLSLSPDGTTDNDEILILGSSDAMFESSAVSAVARWTYDPEAAGVGARGSSRHTMIRFTLEGDVVPSVFLRFYESVDALLQEGKLDEAEDALEDARRKVRTLDDDAWFHWLAFRYWIARDESFVAADELDRMLVNVNLMPVGLVAAAMEAGVLLAVEQGALAKAKKYVAWVRTSERLKTHAEYAGVMQRLEITEQQIDSRLATVQTVLVAGKGIRRYWSHELSHREFSLSEVEGALEGLQVRCSNARAQHLQVQLDSGYKLPATWQNCIVHIEAEPGTRFTLIEFPPEPAAIPAP